MSEQICAISLKVEIDENHLAEGWREIKQAGPKRLSGAAWGHDTGYFIRKLRDGRFEANYPGNYQLGMFPSLRSAQIACLVEEALKQYLVKELGESELIQLL